MAQETYTITVSDTYENAAGVRRKFFAGHVISMAMAYEYGLPGATTPAAPDPFDEPQDSEIDERVAVSTATATAALAAHVAGGINSQRKVEARTATAAGLTTGQVTDGADFVVVTSANADHIIVLPDASIGDVITLQNAGTGYELRTHAPATVGINGGAEADAESAIGANVTVVVRRVNATNWIGTNYAAAGTVSATQVAAAA